MATYIVSYDLRAPDKDYEKLTEYLKSQSAWWHYLGSTWVIVSDLTAVQLRNEIRAHCDANDRILVISAGGTAAWDGFPTKANEWLKKKL